MVGILEMMEILYQVMDAATLDKQKLVIDEKEEIMMKEINAQKNEGMERMQGSYLETTIMY